MNTLVAHAVEERALPSIERAGPQTEMPEPFRISWFKVACVIYMTAMWIGVPVAFVMVNIRR